MNNRTRAVREVLRRLPVSLRAAAREAGVPASSLCRIRSGRLAASRDVARRLALALERIEAEAGEAARHVWDSLEEEVSK